MSHEAYPGEAHFCRVNSFEMLLFESPCFTSNDTVGLVHNGYKRNGQNINIFKYIFRVISGKVAKILDEKRKNYKICVKCLVLPVLPCGNEFHNYIVPIATKLTVIMVTEFSYLLL